MKYLFAYLCALLSVVFVPYAFATGDINTGYSISHPLVKSFDTYWKNLSSSSKLAKFNQVSTLLNAAKNVVVEDKKEFVETLLIAVQDHIQYLSGIVQLDKVSTTNDSMSSSHLPKELGNIDIKKVKEYWLKKHNEERKNVGVEPYTWDDRLDVTAQEWANTNASWKDATHQRVKGDSYYNYDRIEKWFADRGVRFTNVNGKTFSESIWYGPYKCSSSDCTQALISSIDSTFDFFMSEKKKRSRPHYNGIVMKEFNVLGFGIGYDSGNKTYYLVTHYGTEVKE